MHGQELERKLRDLLDALDVQEHPGWLYSRRVQRAMSEARLIVPILEKDRSLPVDRSEPVDLVDV